jgi:small subunit ribosomal protein S11
MRVLKKGVFGKVVIVIIKITLNNVFFTVVSKRGNVIFWSSCGGGGFKGPRRATALAAEQTGRALAEKLFSNGFRWVEIVVHSLYNSRAKAAMKGLSFDNCLQIVSVSLNTPLSHNGLRRKKVRRV